jgi:hypothetical protein
MVNGIHRPEEEGSKLTRNVCNCQSICCYPRPLGISSTSMCGRKVLSISVSKQTRWNTGIYLCINCVAPKLRVIQWVLAAWTQIICASIFYSECPLFESVSTSNILCEVFCGFPPPSQVSTVINPIMWSSTTTTTFFRILGNISKSTTKWKLFL